MTQETARKQMILDTPIKKLSLQKMVYETLRQAILVREIKPGEPINIKKLAEKFSVSTMPVREALRQLEIEGAVSFNSNKRIMVKQLYRQELYEIYELRIPLEIMALSKCFDRCDKPGLRQLDELHRKMTRTGLTGAQWFDLNRTFHMKIYEMAGSLRLFQILQGLWNSTGPYLHIFSESEKAVARANQEHVSMIGALRKGERAVAKKVLRKHLSNGLRVIEPHLNGNGSDGLRNLPWAQIISLSLE
jgi:DNA-binding GntR family transcriptional regulator